MDEETEIKLGRMFFGMLRAIRENDYVLADKTFTEIWKAMGCPPDEMILGIKREAWFLMDRNMHEQDRKALSDLIQKTNLMEKRLTGIDGFSFGIRDTALQRLDAMDSDLQKVRGWLEDAERRFKKRKSAE